METNIKLILRYIFYFIISGIIIFFVGLDIEYILHSSQVLSDVKRVILYSILTLNPMMIAGIILFFSMRLKKKLIHNTNALEKEQEKYKEILDFLPIYVYETDKYGNITNTNETAKRELGYGNELTDGRLNFTDIIQPQDIERATKNLYKRLLGRSDNMPKEYILLKKDGTELKCLIKASIINDDNGVVIGTRGVILDVTDKSILEQKYVDKSKFLNDVINMIPIPFEYRKVDGTYVIVNQAYYDFFGIKESVIGKKDVDVFNYANDRVSSFRKQILKSTEKIQHNSAMISMPNNNKDNKFIEIFSGVHRSLGGRAKGIIDVFTDTTPVKILKSNLEKAYYEKSLSENNFEVLSQNSVVGIVLCNGKQIEFANEYFKNMFDIVDIDIEGADLRKFVLPEYMEAYQTYRDNIRLYGLGKCIVGMDVAGERKLIVLETKITINEGNKSYMTYALDITNYTNKLNCEEKGQITEL